MSAMSRALEMRREWLEKQAVQSSSISRWGPPIWAAEEPVERLQDAACPVIPVEILALVLLQSSRSS